MGNVHNHGPSEGRGLDCGERLIGRCIQTVDEALASGVVVSADKVRALADEWEQLQRTEGVVRPEYGDALLDCCDRLRSLLSEPATDAAPTGEAQTRGEQRG